MFAVGVAAYTEARRDICGILTAFLTEARAPDAAYSKGNCNGADLSFVLADDLNILSHLRRLHRAGLGKHVSCHVAAGAVVLADFQDLDDLAGVFADGVENIVAAFVPIALEEPLAPDLRAANFNEVEVLHLRIP